METDFRKEMDARLNATHARVEQRLMEHTVETNKSFEALRLEMANMNVEMKVQFAKIDARFDSMQATIERAIAEVVKWAVGIFVAAMVAFITIITFVLNHAS
jgi:hypothetical protein